MTRRRWFYDPRPGRVGWPPGDAYVAEAVRLFGVAYADVTRAQRAEGKAHVLALARSLERHPPDLVAFMARGGSLMRERITDADRAEGQRIVDVVERQRKAMRDAGVGESAAGLTVDQRVGAAYAEGLRDGRASDPDLRAAACAVADAWADQCAAVGVTFANRSLADALDRLEAATRDLPARKVRP